MAVIQPPPWFALYTTPRREKRIAAQLQQNRFETFCLSIERCISGRIALARPSTCRYSPATFLYVQRKEHRGSVLSVPGCCHWWALAAKLGRCRISRSRSCALAWGQLNAEPHPYLRPEIERGFEAAPFPAWRAC